MNTMNTVFRVECDTPAGFVEAIVPIPFVPTIGMLIAPLPEADLMEVDSVIWCADKPAMIEVWLKTSPRPWSYWKAQGFTKGRAPEESA